MSHLPAIKMVTGLICGPYQVIRQIQDGSTLQSRIYLCGTTCCGERVERSERALLVNLKEQRNLCSRCSSSRNGELKRKIVTGYRFGPLTVLGVIRRSPWAKYTVRWDCCGGIEDLTGARCYQVHHEAEKGNMPVCRICKGKLPRVRITTDKPRSELSWASVFIGMKRP